MSIEYDSDELLFFCDEDEVNDDSQDEKQSGLNETSKTWRVLIVDDEVAVHETTKLVLKDVQFEGKRLELISAYSSAEARTYLREIPDLAIVLLDVVMESQDAGLKIIKYIREECGNKFTRIILRTGQPGQAPEEKIVLEYDINDYKTKTELTVQKLFTTIISSIRAYKDLVTIEKNRKGLADILSATNKLFEVNSLKKFVIGLITQFTSMYGLEDHTIFARTSGLALSNNAGELVVLAATGEYVDLKDQKLNDIKVHKELIELIHEAKEKRDSVLTDQYFVGYYQSLGKIDNFFVVKGLRQVDAVDKNMIQVFSEHIAVAFDSFIYHERVVNSQREMILRLSEILEHDATEHDRHLNTLANMVYALAPKLGVSEQDAYLLSLASALHDLGNVDVAREILEKPEMLTLEEFNAVQLHTQYGKKLLNHSTEEIISLAAIIAFSHHEHWDGSGYPLGLKEDQIHIYSRIVSVVDIYITLQRKTHYREAWSKEKTISYLREYAGIKFDPQVVELFLDNLEALEKGIDGK